MTDLQSCNAESLVRLPETRFNGRQFGLTVSGIWQTLQQLLLNRLIKPYLDFLLPLKVILNKKFQRLKFVCKVSQDHCIGAKERKKPFRYKIIYFKELCCSSQRQDK